MKPEKAMNNEQEHEQERNEYRRFAASLPDWLRKAYFECATCNRAFKESRALNENERDTLIRLCKELKDDRDRIQSRLISAQTSYASTRRAGGVLH